MADDSPRNAKGGGWSAGAQGLAAIVTTALAVAAFFGLTHMPGSQKPADNGSATLPAENSGGAGKVAPVTAATVASNGEARAATALGIAPVRASIAAAAGSSDTTRVVTATVTVRFRNTTDTPFSAAWLDGRNGMTFDLDDGTHIAGSAASTFFGVPNCEFPETERCSSNGFTPFAPGEEQNATVTLQAEMPVQDLARLETASKGAFSGRLVLTRGSDAPVAQAVSFDVASLVNTLKHPASNAKP